ncbi:ATP-grasp domain-containing protein [Maridesulfovibrio sp.]|uniref:ATP-grasp domain-containing protein n=1 Tax=Maridesulfovibrio sp. TaxID=2795000 RepID=UPI002AA8D9B6|nr:ATP-grasp domain-containing protein [Maridesulfovibrio sp.]
MSKPVIGLLANHGSTQLDAIREAVEAEGGQPLVLDIRLGGENKPTMTITDDSLKYDGYDLSDVRAIHIRCNALNTIPSLPPVMNPTTYAQFRHQFLVEQEYYASTMSFFDEYRSRGGLLVNSLSEVYLDHDSKSQFYEKLAANGFPAPVTLSTNSPERAEAFVREVGEAVVKPASGVGSTRIVTTADLASLSRLSHSPILMQECVKGPTIRVHIVGDQVVLALKIINEGGVDSRTETKEFHYYDMPEDACEKIVRCNRMLGLHYAAWDVIEVEGGNGYCYLDCNPGPYVMWIGEDFYREVFRNLARYMIVFAESGSVEQASRSVRRVERI